MPMVFPKVRAVGKGATKWKSIRVTYDNEVRVIEVTYIIDNKEKMLSRYLMGLSVELLPTTNGVMSS